MHKSDLRDGYPDRIFTAERSNWSYSRPSGTTGKPTVAGIQSATSPTGANLLHGRLLLRPWPGFSVSYGYGLFTGGLGTLRRRASRGDSPPDKRGEHRAPELIGSPVTAIACTPSYLLHIAEVAEKMGVSIRDDTDLQMGFLGAETWSEQMRTRIQDWLGIRAYDIYGTSELSGPMFTECSEQQGIHVWGDLALLEVVDPATGEVLEPGEAGELTVTMLQKEALPMIRYRTGDLTAIDTDPCACGRTHPRIGRIRGRVDDMLIVRGINVFPSQVEHTLLEIPEVGKHFQIVVDRKGALDSMLVRVEVSEEAFSDRIPDLMEIKRTVEHRLRSSLNVSVEVELVEPGTLPRFEGKSRKVIDRRSL